MDTLSTLAQGLGPLADSVLHPTANDPWTLINVLLGAIASGLVGIGVFVRWVAVAWNQRANEEQAMRNAESKARIEQDKKRTESLEALVELSGTLLSSTDNHQTRWKKIWRHMLEVFDELTKHQGGEKVNQHIKAIRDLCEE